jgi:VWFA-related protein
MLTKIVIFAASAVILCPGWDCALAQNPTGSNGDETSFTLAVPVNEVRVIFHASDSRGIPLEHLKRNDVELFDNGKRQSRIVAFKEFRDLPIRVGFLLDYSPSMEHELDRSQAIATELTKEFFLGKSDRAFTMGFGVDTSLTQDWTGDADAVSSGISAALSKQMSGPDGTAMFDAIFRACKDSFSDRTTVVAGNFILLFTDGEDNSSHVWEPETVDMCQRARTAIYVFAPRRTTMEESRGQELLENLVAQTGGRVFSEGKQSIHDALATVISDMRYQYEMVYAPPKLKRDGSFHRIKLKCNVERSQVQARSGYYAYAKPSQRK